MDEIRRLGPFSKEAVNRAGDVLRDPASTSADQDRARSILNDWRSAHQEPVTRFKEVLSKRASALKIDASPVSRLKRTPTMIDKLQRLAHKRDLTLWDFQDIGGVRAVVDSAPEASALADTLCDASPNFALQRGRDAYDYIQHPTSLGYRSIHLVYAYAVDPDDDPKLDSLYIEVQIRSRLQHAWATAIEFVGVFRGEALKSGKGDAGWLRFFKLAGALIARKENTPMGSKVPRNRAALDAELQTLRTRLQVHGAMNAYFVAETQVWRKHKCGGNTSRRVGGG